MPHLQTRRNARESIARTGKAFVRVQAVRDSATVT
jgi:hypothetical protein